MLYDLAGALTNKIFRPKKYSLSSSCVFSSGFFFGISCLVAVMGVHLRPQYGKRNRGTTFAIVQSCLRGTFSFMFLKN
jgi:hypothetical protein